MGRQGGDEPLGETAVEGLGAPAAPGGHRLGRRRIDGHQVQVRPRRHLTRPGLAQSHHGDRAVEGPAHPLSLGQGRRGQPLHAGVGQGGVGQPGLLGRGPAGDDMHADTEGLFAVQAAHGVHGPFEIAGLMRLAHHLIGQAGVGAQGRHEARVQHPVQSLRLTSQRPRQSRREGHDPDHQVEQLGLIQEQGLHLHPGAEARKEDGEPAEGRVRRPRPGHRRQQLRRQAGEQLASPRRARRLNAAVVPAADRVGHRGGLGKAHAGQGLQRAGVVLHSREH